MRRDCARNGGSVPGSGEIHPDMTTERERRQEDTHFWVMKLLEENPDITQRELAKALGISLGGVNYCLQALVEKGWIKIQNFSNNKHKMGYVYLLTPTGIAERAALTTRFLRRKMREYEALQEEIAMLQKDAARDPNL